MDDNMRQRLLRATAIGMAGNGRSWRCEEPVRAILAKFSELMDMEPRDKRTRKEWTVGGRAFVEQVGEDAELLERAFREMDKRMLTIKTPRSLIAVALELRRRGGDSYELRGRYLGGVLGGE